MLYNKRLGIGIGISVSIITGYYLYTHQTPADHDVHREHISTARESVPQHTDHTMHMAVTSERDFITNMIPHHQEAVDTASAVLARGGTTPEIRQLAANIITAQEAEIATMKQWYETWYTEPYADTETYVPMMRSLEQLSGAALDRVFLEDMIPHHEGAIMMAESVQPFIEHEEIAALVNEIIASQRAEIATMRNLLSTLP